MKLKEIDLITKIDEETLQFICGGISMGEWRYGQPK